MAPPRLPLSLASLAEDKYAVYQWLLDNAPVCPARIYGYPITVVSRFEDCTTMLTGDDFVRDRSGVVGRSWWLRLLPRPTRLSALSMLNEDGDSHRRLRSLVNKAFSPRAIRDLEPHIETLTQRVLDDVADRARGDAPVDVLAHYALPIPVRVIGAMLGIEEEDWPEFFSFAELLARGFEGARIIRTLLWDARRLVKFLEGIIAKKRRAPSDDILSNLIRAEEDGDRLSTDELVSMVILLVSAGYETTVGLIANAVVTLTEHPEALQALRDDPEQIPAAVEEVLRYASPIQATDRQYAREDITLHGTTIRRGSMAVALIGAANRDPRVFEDPDVFRIDRDADGNRNRNLAFGRGPHFCLGMALARMEGRIAIRALLDRFAELKLAIPHTELKLVKIPLNHQYEAVPVTVRAH